MPARDHLVSAYIVPVGSVNIFIGLTAEALGFCNDLGHGLFVVTRVLAHEALYRVLLIEAGCLRVR